MKKNTMHSAIGFNNKIMKSSRFLGVFSAGIICFGGGLLQAQTTAGLINVDFNGNSIGTAYNGGGPDPGPTQSGAVLIGSTGDIWNGFSDSDLGFTTTPNTPGPISASGLALNYANGSSSGVLMSLTASSTYDAQSFGNHSPFVTAGSAYQNLMQDLLVANSLETVTLSGLAPNATFNLILYNAGDNNVGAGRTSTFAVNGVTQTSDWDGATSTLVAGIDYVNYSSVTSDGSGNLVIDYGLSSGGESDLDGFQLLAVPEPSTWAMLTAGGVMLLGYRRGFRRA